MGYNWYTSTPHTGSITRAGRAGRAGRAYRPTKGQPIAFRLTTQTDHQQTHRSNRPAPRDSLRAGTPAGGGAGATALKLSVGADQPNHLKAFI